MKGKYYWQNDLIKLRPVSEDDWQIWYEENFDSRARLMHEEEIELPPYIEDEKEGLGHFVGCNEYHGITMFAIEDNDGKFIGITNINSIDERSGTFSMAMQLLGSCRGKGYGTSVAIMMLSYAFYERRLHKFNASVLEGNVGSITLLQKLGCVQEGRRRQVVYTAGEYYDIILYGLTREEFEAKYPPQRIIQK